MKIENSSEITNFNFDKGHCIIGITFRQGKEYDFDLGTGKEGGHSGMSRGTYENEPFPIPAWMGGEHLGKWTTSGQAKMRRDKAGALNDFILKKISDKGTWDALTSNQASAQAAGQRDDERYGD